MRQKCATNVPYASREVRESTIRRSGCPWTKLSQPIQYHRAVAHAPGLNSRNLFGTFAR